jgi:branched-subunit amino acid ABC-type transport system permease component
LVFGANNVQVDSPAWLSGNWTVHDVILGWNRVFVIAFAIAIIVGTWLLLTKTPWDCLFARSPRTGRWPPPWVCARNE